MMIAIVTIGFLIILLFDLRVFTDNTIGAKWAYLAMLVLAYGLIVLKSFNVSFTIINQFIEQTFQFI